MITKLKSFFFPYRGRIQTFTYYIPAPPARKTGYREKEFDKIFYIIASKGFKILNYKLIAHNSSNHSGIWAMFLLQGTNRESDKLHLEDDFGSNEAPPIDGLYPLTEDKLHELD